MNEATLAAVAAELSANLENRPFGKIFQLSKLQFAIDFRLPGGKYFFISVEPSNPRVYLITRRLKDLERQSQNPAPFLLFVRKRLANAVLQGVAQDENERILRLYLLARDDIEGTKRYVFVAQMTGRSANLFLLDDKDFILDSLRENHGDGQQTAQKFAAPATTTVESKDDAPQKTSSSNAVFPRGNFETLSAALDFHFQNLEAEKRFAAQAKIAADKLKQEITKREKLRKKLVADLENHGDAEKWKHLGDTLLANLSNAARVGDKVLAVDYFDENAPTIEIEVAENLSLTEAAEKFFRRYTKARNAKLEIAKRLADADAQLTILHARKDGLEKAVAEKDENFLAAVAGEKDEVKIAKSKDKRDETFRGARKFISSDDFEILVGKQSKDNDYLTFRVAKSLDFWFHAADYAGSHVVVRNPNRLEILPSKTLVEAAQLAAFYSQGRAQTKAAVNYTQKKFVNKPKGAAAGLVSLSSFKTILVEPQIELKSV